MKKIVFITLALIACSRVDPEIERYSDRDIEFDYPVTAKLDNPSKTNQEIKLILQEETEGKEKKIWLVNSSDHNRNGAGFVRIFHGDNEIETDTFIRKLLPSYCKYKTINEKNGIEEIVPYQEHIDLEGPFCNHSNYRLFRKNNTVIQKYTGVECVFSHNISTANHNCEEFINFHVKT